MIKRIILSATTVLVLVGMALPAFAAGNAQLLLSTSRTNVGVGASFSVTVSINPGGNPIDTARANLSFSPDTLQVQSVSLSGRLSSATPNNNFDNTSGTVSWGGYGIQNPINNTETFLRINFRAKTAGKAKVTALANSRLVSAGQEKNSGATSSVNISVDSTLPSEGEAGELTVSSPSHPDPTVWYSKNLVQIRWTSISDATYLYSFDAEPDSVPTKVTSSQSKDYKHVSSGVHYFHIRAKKSNGTLTPVVNFPIMVDTLAPNSFSPYLDTDESGNLTLHFGTTDSHSGVDHYSLSINSQPTTIVISPYALKGLHQGENLAEVYAVDKAGNQTRGWIKFMINADGTYREIAHSGRACRTASICLSAILSKSVIGGVMLSLILLILLFLLTRKRKEHHHK